MNDRQRVEHGLEQWLEEVAQPRVPDYVQTMLEHTRTTRQRPAWMFAGRGYGHPGGVGSFLARQPAWLLLVISLLAAAVLATALAVGSALTSKPPLLTTQDDAAPAPTSTARPYRVEVPADVTPVSRPEDVERVLSATSHPAVDLAGESRRIESMEWVPPGVEYPHADGGASMSERSWWAVDLVGGDGNRVVVMLDDETLEIWGSGPGPGGAVPSEGPFVPRPGPTDPDPSSPLALESSDGDAITPAALPIPDAEKLPSVPALVGSGDYLWLLVSFGYQDDPPYLLRVHTETHEVTKVDLPGAQQPDVVSLWAGGGLVWTSSRGQMRALDPATGQVRRSFAMPVDGWPVGLDEHGLWLGTRGGIALVDPETGELRRRIETREGEGHAYRRIAQPPSFGSLWDYDRGAGVVHRIDPVSGETQATIEVGDTVDHEGCGGEDLRPLVGLRGMPDLVAAYCSDRTVLIDPATNSVVRTVPGGNGRDFVVDGAWWSLRVPDAVGAGWDAPGTLTRLDPESGTPLELFTFTKDQTAGFWPVVTDESLWFLVGQRVAANHVFEHNPRLVEIRLADLRDGGGQVP